MYEPRQILVPTDFTSTSQAALQYAQVLARHFAAPLHLVHSVQEPMVGTYREAEIPRGLFDTLRDQAWQRMLSLHAELVSQDLAVTVELDGADAITTIQHTADTKDANLIVMGTHGQSGFQRLVLGSVAEQTIRKARCPVIAVHEEDAKDAAPPQRILVATDFSPHSECAARVAFDLAAACDATVVVAHAFSPPPGIWGAAVGKLRKKAASKFEQALTAMENRDLCVQGELVEGPPAEAIVALAKRLRSDLIVLGTRGSSGLPHVLLGSVAEQVLRQAPCPVLTTKEGNPG